MAAVTEYLPTGSLKATEIVFSRSCWRLEVQNQGVVRVTPPLKALGKNPSLPIPDSGGPEHSLSCGCRTPTSASAGASSLCLCPLPFVQGSQSSQIQGDFTSWSSTDDFGKKPIVLSFVLSLSFLLLLFFFFFFFFFFCLLRRRPHLQHIEVPGLGMELERQLLA